MATKGLSRLFQDARLLSPDNSWDYVYPLEDETQQALDIGGPECRKVRVAQGFRNDIYFNKKEED